MFGLNEIHPAVQKLEYLLTKADAAVAIIYGGKIVVAVYVQYKSSSKTVESCPRYPYKMLLLYSHMWPGVSPIGTL